MNRACDLLISLIIAVDVELSRCGPGPCGTIVNCEELTDYEGTVGSQNDDVGYEFTWIFSGKQNVSEGLLLRTSSINLKIESRGYWWCGANLTIQGTSICSLKPGTCVIITRQDCKSLVNLEEAENCSKTIRILDHSAEYKLYFKKRGKWYEDYHNFRIEYKVIPRETTKGFSSTSAPQIRKAGSVTQSPPEYTLLFESAASFATNHTTMPSNDCLNQCAQARNSSSAVITIGIICGILSFCMIIVSWKLWQTTRIRNCVSRTEGNPGLSSTDSPVTAENPLYESANETLKSAESPGREIVENQLYNM